MHVSQQPSRIARKRTATSTSTLLTFPAVAAQLSSSSVPCASLASLAGPLR